MQTSKTFTIRTLSTKDEIAVAQRLRYDVWLAEGADIKFPAHQGISDGHDDHATHWGAFVDDVLVGAARLCLHDHIADAPDAGMFATVELPEPVASLNRLVVRRQHRCVGIGTALDLSRIEQAKLIGAATVIATPVDVDNRIRSLTRRNFQFVPDVVGTSIWSRNVPVRPCYLLTGDRSTCDQEIVPTHNGYGWTSTVPNQITEALCEWLSSLPQTSAVLDIGAGLGVGTFPLLKIGAKVTALDMEATHLDSIRNEAYRLGLANNLSTVEGQFPNTQAFADLDAIHCSNVLHFLTGSEIDEGAVQMFRWLRPGGKVFIQVGTIFAGHITRLVPLFESHRRAGIKWAGETHSAKDYVAPAFRDTTPTFMNYLDESPLVAAFKTAGFSIEYSGYYRRNGLPEAFHNDGREHCGVIATKTI